eukprot:1267175-Amphidinium_carterae.1
MQRWLFHQTSRAWPRLLRPLRNCFKLGGLVACIIMLGRAVCRKSWPLFVLPSFHFQLYPNGHNVGCACNSFELWPGLKA